jgi:hypothetical protein
LVSTLNDLLRTVVANAAIVAAGTGGSINVYASNATDIVIDINGYYSAFFGTPSGGYEFPNASGTALMAIAPTGDVGIGTTTPGSALDVAGDINMSGRLLYNGSAILSVTSGGTNVGIGAAALAHNTVGNQNTAIGFDALEFNTSGMDNIAIGLQTLFTNTTGYGNTATGNAALTFNQAGNYNTATGLDALYYNSTGALNTATGHDALLANTIGTSNTATGDSALLHNTTGNNNIGIGFQAAFVVSGGNSNNIHIGTQGTSADNGTIRIGGNATLGDPATQTQFFASGIRGTTTANNDAVPVVIDSAGQLGTVSSSRRFKEEIQGMGDASSGLMHLRPVTFRYQKPFADGSKPIQYGLIAEEVAEVYPDLVAHSADGQIETVKYQVLDSMLLNEIQRQEKVIGEQKDEIRILKDRLSRLEAAMVTTTSGAGK